MGFLNTFKTLIGRGDMEPAAAESMEQRAMTAVEVTPVELRTGVGTEQVTVEQLLTMMTGGPTRAGVVVNEKTALQCVAVFAAVKVISEAIGMLPCLIYEGDEDGDDHKLSLTHRLRSMLRYQPNPEQTAATFKETQQTSVLLYGNSYSRILRDGLDRVAELRPLDPSKTHPERYAGQLRYTVDGGGVFDPEEILHIPGLSFDGLRGLSPIALARQNIGLSLAAESFGASFFGNGSNMGGVLSFKQKLSPESRKALEAAWTAQQAGLAHAAKTAVIDGDATYTRIGIPPEDAQFLQTRSFGVKDIARLFRVPPHMLADMEKASYASIEQSALEFLTYTLMPWLNKWELELKRKLLMDEQAFVKFDVRQLLRGDMAAQQAFFASGRQWGYLTVNEIRRKLNFPDVEGGNVFLAPVNMQIAPGQSGAPTPVSPAAPVTIPVDEEQRAVVAATSIGPLLENLIGDFHRQERTALSRAETRAMKPAAVDQWRSDFYNQHESRFRADLAAQARAFITAVGRTPNASAIDKAVASIASQRAAEGLSPADAAGSLMKSLLEEPAPAAAA